MFSETLLFAAISEDYDYYIDSVCVSGTGFFGISIIPVYSINISLEMSFLGFQLGNLKHN